MKHVTPPPMAEDMIDPLASFSIETLLRLHPYDVSRLEKAYKILDEEIRSFDPIHKNENASLPFGGRVIQSYGEYLEDHLQWTSETLKNFLDFLGFDESITVKVAQAFKRHDVGKPSMPGEWKITEGKQNVPDDVRYYRTKQHCLLGAQRIHQAMEDMGPDISNEEIVGFMIAENMALYHHERLNGSGPFGLTAAQLCPVLRAATIVDTFHGKLKAGKSPDQICQEMASAKHEGEFDAAMLSKFSSFVSSPAPATRKDALFQP